MPYLFCSDELVRTSVSCQRWDQGADPYEMAVNVVDSYENYYFFNNYRRDKFGFNSFQVYSRILGRYFSYLPNIYQHWLFQVAFFGVDDITQDIYWTMGNLTGYNKLISVLSQPSYGTYCRSDNGVDCVADGAEWVRASSSLADPNGEPNRYVVGRGAGRSRFSRYDFDSGYYYYRKILEVGHFWEYVAALQALTQSSGTFLGVELATDFRTYSVPYYLLFDGSLTRVFEGIFGENYGSYAPKIVNGELRLRPATTLTLTPGNQQVDPRTGDILPDPGVEGGEPMNLDNWFTQRYWAALFGMSDFRSNFSLRFTDRMQIFRMGTGEEVEPGPNHVVETCRDPIGGHEYGTLRPIGLSPEELASPSAGGLRALCSVPERGQCL